VVETFELQFGMFLARLGDEKDSSEPGGALGLVVHAAVVQERTTDDFQLFRVADNSRAVAISIPSICYMLVSGRDIV